MHYMIAGVQWVACVTARKEYEKKLEEENEKRKQEKSSKKKSKGSGKDGKKYNCTCDMVAVLLLVRYLFPMF
jgi:hypothetical protein